MATYFAKKYKMPIIGVCTDSPSNIAGTNRAYTMFLLRLARSLNGYICLTPGLNELFNDQNKPIEEPGLKKRVTIQYFIAAFLDLCFALLFLKFIFSSNKSSKNIDNIIEEPKIENIKIEEKQEINTNSINNEEINSINTDNNQNQGMSEKY